MYGAPFVSKRMFPVSIRSCRTRGDDSFLEATILFSRRRFFFRGDESIVRREF